MTKLTWAVVVLNLLHCTFGSEFISQLQQCPNDCTNLGPNPSNWTFIHYLEKLNSCNHTVLFDLSLHNDVADHSTHTTIRACTVAVGDDPKTNTIPVAKQANSTSFSASILGAQSGKNVQFNQDEFEGLSGAIQQHVIALDENAPTIILGKIENLVMGFFAGGSIDSSRSIAAIIHELTSQVKAVGLSETTLVQRCGQDLNGNHTVGLVVNTDGNVASVQNTLLTWSNATCVQDLEVIRHSNITMFSKPTIKSQFSRRGINSRDGTCSTVQVVSGDSCGSLATECGISAQDLATFNPASDLCSTLAVGQYICCTSGSLPDLSPKPNPDGSCAQYAVQPNDYCALIASENSITITDIENWNQDTWGWQGCDNVQLGQVICLSTGTPPFPASVSNAICGPQVPGTQPPADFSTLTDLNPCPLNSCCDIYGQCGITPDFCTISKSTTGAPGTSAPGTAGCISNCGTEITNNSEGPSEFIKVGYWESFNLDRPCLQMPVSAIPSGYTHIHYAFATLTEDFLVDVSADQDAFNDFAAATGFKRILSFGGWSFSTDVDSFPIFRDSVTSANRLTFAQSVVDIVNQHNLDGVDFDWEYPGAPDIPGIPPGSPNDGANYLAFLQTLRNILPEGKTLSLAAPASYWSRIRYLRGFPIADMAQVLDYIVYETYDLHGQWDYANAFSNPGCPTGNCLRSHVNLTETDFALAMITKAGVPTNKITVGVTSYGRSFGMVDPSCTSVDCLFSGPDSSAIPGACTQTAGYLADAEIYQLIGQGAIQSRDDASDSDIVTYQDTWVAYMTPATKASRISSYQAANFAGSVDWAIDLEA
ncbi:glycoside hydrolase family 18 protein, partial [Trichoderma harzianum CBS 226.95]